MNTEMTYLIGVDGGGTGTRVIITDCNLNEIARGQAGASGLRNGVEFAWHSVLSAIQSALHSANLSCPSYNTMAIGLGLAGVHNKQWAARFLESNPGFGNIVLETDAFTTLAGAHGAGPGGIIALGTGSVGESVTEEGIRVEVGGWGFPCGDEAGGAWLGLRAVNYLQQVIDGRSRPDDFSDALLQHCGGQRDAVFNWLAAANQGSYAQIAPVVVQYANHKKNLAAVQMMQDAAQQIVNMALALDRTEKLALALCGGLAPAYRPYLPDSLVRRLVTPHGDSAYGALLLIKKAIEGRK